MTLCNMNFIIASTCSHVTSFVSFKSIEDSKFVICIISVHGVHYEIVSLLNAITSVELQTVRVDALIVSTSLMCSGVQPGPEPRPPGGREPRV